MTPHPTQTEGETAEMPERIWAQVDRATVYMDGTQPVIARMVEPPHGQFVAYLRADLAAAQAARIAEMEAALREMRVVVRATMPAGEVPRHRAAGALRRADRLLGDA